MDELDVACIAPVVLPNAHNEQVDAPELDIAPTTTVVNEDMAFVSMSLLVVASL